MISEEIEVEVRFWIEDVFRAEQYLPNIKIDSMKLTYWETIFFGKKILEEGCLLRLSKTKFGDETSFFVGWKDIDKGSVANIRREYSEEVDINNVTSDIAKLKLGYGAAESWDTFSDIETLFGENKFMGFSGNNYSGYMNDQGFDVKVMTTTAPKWPILIELEKTANTMAEAYQIEKELFSYIRRIGLEERLIKHEPPSLLYRQVFHGQHPERLTANKSVN